MSSHSEIMATPDEVVQNEIPTEPTKVRSTIELMDMDEWMKQGDEEEERRKANFFMNPGTGVSSKKTKQVPMLDAEVKAAEQLALDEMGDTNWVGMLLEYRNVHPVAGEGIAYVELTNYHLYFPRFTCDVLITECPDHVGSSRTSPPVSFTAKKHAKRYAAKKAIDWLIEQKLMPGNGAIAFPKPKKSPLPPTTKVAVSSPTTSEPQTPPPTAGSFAGLVPDLCHRLGISTPTYVLEQAAPNSPLWDAHADFGNDPSVEGRVGAVRNVYGKKNAKEQVAKIVVSFLKDIERQRLAVFDEEKRRTRGSSSALDGASEDTVKVQA